jgi:hypothetical protein
MGAVSPCSCAAYISIRTSRSICSISIARRGGGQHACMHCAIPLPHPCTARHAATNQAKKHAWSRGSSWRGAQACMSNKILPCRNSKADRAKRVFFLLRFVACIMQCRPAFFLFLVKFHPSAHLKRDFAAGGMMMVRMILVPHRLQHMYSLPNI